MVSLIQTDLRVLNGYMKRWLFTQNHYENLGRTNKLFEREIVVSFEYFLRWVYQ